LSWSFLQANQLFIIIHFNHTIHFAGLYKARYLLKVSLADSVTDRSVIDHKFKCSNSAIGIIKNMLVNGICLQGIWDFYKLLSKRSQEHIRKPIFDTILIVRREKRNQSTHRIDSGFGM
jgi:hypothetical protein